MKTIYYQSFANHRIKINLDKAIISFSFDDVPRSALINGVPLLDKYEIKSSFYVSAGLSEEQANNKETAYLNSDDIISLHNAGHHIACHTYSHYMLKNGNANELAADAKKNVDRLQSMLGSTPIEHFSYPFGQVNLKEKKLLAKSYNTMRSSRPGINKSLADMFLLRAISIYNPHFDTQVLTNVIQKTEQAGGWLVFYTHGVEENPDDFSCTPEQFKWILQACVKSSAEILPVDLAYKKIIAACVK